LLYAVFVEHLRESILATIVYYDILNFPLTLFEIKKFLIHPARLRPAAQSSVEAPPSLSDIQKEIDGLAAAKKVVQQNGFYFLNGRNNLCVQRAEKEKISAQKWKKLLKAARWFAAVPYLRGIFVGGSMAINNTAEEGDFDILAVARVGRLYTCRLFLSLAASLFGARRKRFDKVAPDKFCFNHYIVDTVPGIEHQSLFNAQSYASLTPILAGEELFEKFYGANEWIQNFILSFEPSGKFVFKKIKPNPILAETAKIGEAVFNSVFGGWLEKILKSVQQRRIRKNPVTYESGGRVVFSDSELEFHPRSFEKTLVEQYNRGLKRTGILTAEQERDSGLN